MVVKRGDVFLADLGNERIGSELAGKRPIVVIQNNIANKYASTIIIAPISSNISKIKLPTHIKANADNGLSIDSIILLEQVRAIDKGRLQRKIGSITMEQLIEIENSIPIAIPTGLVIDPSKLEDLKDNLKRLLKPLVITEGKTDVKIINTAWQKLYPNREMIFDCVSSGIEIEEENRLGGAENLRREIEYLTKTSERPTIGLFDNDVKGNEQFKGLNKKIFEEYDIKKNWRKHKERNIWAILLPVPPERKLFVTDNDNTQRYLVIEHYFSDKILKQFNMHGNNILGTDVFKINNKKDEFAEEICKLNSVEFNNFKILFNTMKQILNH